MIDSDKRNMIGWSEEAKENAKWAEDYMGETNRKIWKRVDLGSEPKSHCLAPFVTWMPLDKMGKYDDSVCCELHW